MKFGFPSVKFVVAVFFGLYAHLLLAQVPVTVPASWGDWRAIKNSYQNIPVFSNGIWQLTPYSPVRGPYGLQYQCVEFVKRFYAEALKVDVKDWNYDAVNFFDEKNDKAMELRRIPNHGPVPPEQYDIIVFQYSSKDNVPLEGHVAIVTEVTNGTVKMIEQNWSPNGEKDLTLSFQDGIYSLEDRISRPTGKPAVTFLTLGWLRKEVVVPLTLTTGQDIWTTSVYSYAPSGPTPGGGLDNDELVVGGWGDQYYSLIRFDLAGHSYPTFARSVTLQQYCFTSRSNSLPQIGVYQNMSPWDWTTITGRPDNLRLWWADLPSATLLSIWPAPTVGKWYSIDITALYNSWQNDNFLIESAPNFGVQLRPVSTNNEWAEFYSSNYTGDASLRPKLVIEPGVAPTPTPPTPAPSGPPAPL